MVSVDLCKGLGARRDRLKRIYIDLQQQGGHLSIIFPFSYLDTQTDLFNLTAKEQDFETEQNNEKTNLVVLLFVHGHRYGGHQLVALGTVRPSACLTRLREMPGWQDTDKAQICLKYFSYFSWYRPLFNHVVDYLLQYLGNTFL